MEKWEQAQIDRLEQRVYQLERKNWERSDFGFRLTMYGFIVAYIVLLAIAVALHASNS